MTWSISAYPDAFRAAAGGFLAAAPVDHTVLLTEAAYLAARPRAAAEQRFGWWQTGSGAVTGAFLQAPGHAPVLSPMPDDGLAALADLLPALRQADVDGRCANAAGAAWRRHGVALAEHGRIRLYRLGGLRMPELPAGRSRTAVAADRPLLVGWFEQLMAAFPDDPSELAYVVDDPLGYGGLTLWEVGGVPYAMAGRSRLVAGMVRLSAVYSPHGDAYGQAAFAASCQAAQGVARDVLVFAGAADTAADRAYRGLGFVPVLDRVTLRA
jgi:hypothetical protein